MGLLSNLRNKYIIAPAAKQITAEIQKASAQPSIFSVPTGFNSAVSSYNKQMGSNNNVGWDTLRSLSVNHETTRAAINIRKRQITQLGYDVVDIDDDSDPEQNRAERNKIRDFLTNIGGEGVRFRYIL